MIGENGTLSGTFAPRHTPYDDLALYAMQFLGAEEAGPISLHLDHCPACRSELAQVQGDLAIYACTADLHAPPAAVRQRLMKQVAREKKFFPAGAPARELLEGRDTPDARTLTAVPSIAPAADETAGPALASFGRSSSLFAVAETKPSRHIGRTVFAWSGWAIAASLAVATTFVYRERNELRGVRGSQESRIAQLAADAATARVLNEAITDPKAVRVTLTKPKATPAATARITYNADKGTLLLFASNLDKLQMYKVYELWVIPADGKDAIPAGTFHPDGQGNASLIMPDVPKGVVAKGFGVTVEDDGGSQIPTKPIVLFGG